MAMNDYFSQHRPQTIRHFFPLGRCDCRWLRNDFSIPRAPENMSHKNIIMIHFHIWTWYTPTIVISRVCHRPINELVQNFGPPARNFGSPKTEFAWWEWRKMLGRNVAQITRKYACSLFIDVYTINFIACNTKKCFCLQFNQSEPCWSSGCARNRRGSGTNIVSVDVNTA